MNIIKSFKKCINKSIYRLNSYIKIRKNNKIQLKDVIYYSSLVIGNDISYDIINSHLKIHNIINVAKNSLIKKKIK